MKKSVFDYTDYKPYLRHLGESRGHGFQAQMAKAIGCHSAYISQVLNKDAHFSPEQGQSFNRFAGHSNEESLYFLLLIQYGRAGSKDLREILLSQIQSVQRERQIFHKRVDIRETLSKEFQMKYYSSWIYAAIHILVTIPAYQTKNAICERLGLSMDKVNSALEFLMQAGLLRQEGDRFQTGVARIFLERDSDMYSRHQINWRIKAIESLDQGSAEDLHFGSVVSLALSDLQQIREALVQGIENARQIIKASKEEELCCLTLDFFKIGH